MKRKLENGSVTKEIKNYNLKDKEGALNAFKLALKIIEKADLGKKDLDPENNPLFKATLYSFEGAVKALKSNKLYNKELGETIKSTVYVPALLANMESITQIEYVQKNMQSMCAVMNYLTADVYYNGHGVEKNYDIAAKFYHQAAEQGYVDAKVDLGSMYCNGFGVIKDYTKGRELFEAAAAQGQSLAQINLGHLYIHGDGVTRDINMAIKYFGQAALQGSFAGQYILGMIYYEGKDFVIKNYDKARELFESAAAQDYAPAQFNLGCMYLNGNGVDKDINHAIKYFGQAAVKAYSSAQYKLGEIYYNGTDGVIKDYNKARELFEKSAAQGNADALNYLGSMYFNGDGVAQDYEKARELLEKSAKSGNVTARVRLGNAFEYKQTDRDFGHPLEICQWFVKCIENSKDNLNHRNFMDDLFNRYIKARSDTQWRHILVGMTHLIHPDEFAKYGTLFSSSVREYYYENKLIFEKIKQFKDLPIPVFDKDLNRYVSVWPEVISGAREGQVKQRDNLRWSMMALQNVGYTYKDNIYIGYVQDKVDKNKQHKIETPNPIWLPGDIILKILDLMQGACGLPKFKELTPKGNEVALTFTDRYLQSKDPDKSAKEAKEITGWKGRS